MFLQFGFLALTFRETKGMRLKHAVIERARPNHSSKLTRATIRNKPVELFTELVVHCLSHHLISSGYCALKLFDELVVFGLQQAYQRVDL
jgi:hypothetical protein